MVTEHKILQMNTEFRDFFEKLFNTNDLSNLHETCKEYLDFKNGLIEDISDYETELHKKFYSEIKLNNKFKRLYCELIQKIHKTIFPEEKFLVYQSFPSIRFQFPGNIAVPPHYDSDNLGKHPLGEKNFLLPITSMRKSQRLFIESSPGLKDFKGVDLDYGDLFYFNGNTCTHYNEKNIENTLRISLDFRVILKSDYMKYVSLPQLTTTNPRDPEGKRTPTKMYIGGYYQVTEINDDLDKMENWHFQRDFLLQTRPNFDTKEADAVYEYMKGDNFVTEFKKTDELEKEICKYIGSKYCVMTTSGTSALLLSLMALEIKEGDEVIVPNYTMIATINAIKMVGATPVIADVDPDTFTLSLSNIEGLVTPKTKAIMHVSLNNRHTNIKDIVIWCEKNKILLIEDAAQSLGCFTGNQHFGTFGKIGCFSLSTPKIISTGQGGFLVTDDAELARKMVMIKNFGRKEGGIDNFEVFGLNLKFTDIQAVIALEQMKKLESRVKRMREMFDLYYRELSGVCRMVKPIEDTWIPWFIDIFIEKRDDLANFLKKHNIQTRSTYPEINKTPMYLDTRNYPISEFVSEHGLFLPSHTLLTNNEILHISKLIVFFINN